MVLMLESLGIVAPRIAQPTPFCMVKLADGPFAHGIRFLLQVVCERCAELGTEQHLAQQVEVSISVATRTSL